MGLMILLFGAVGMVVVLNIWATRVVRRQIELPAHQRSSQILFIWIVPVIGAVIAIEVHRRPALRRPRSRLVADEIHPIVDQALRPLADAEMRASEQYIEKDLIDFGHDLGGHGHSDGPH